jgi:hypothetical protein
MIQITFNPDGTAEHLGDEHSPAAALLPDATRHTKRASHIEPCHWLLRIVFHAIRAWERFMRLVEADGAEHQPFTAWTRTWKCNWRVRVVGGPVLPGCYLDRSEAIRAEIRWLEEHRL